MIKLLTQLSISVGDIDSIKNPTSNQLVINRSDVVIKRYTGGWNNFKIYSVKEFDDIIDNTRSNHNIKLLNKVSVEEGKDLVDVDFSNAYFNKLNGIEYNANLYVHPENDIHLNTQMVTLFDTYEDRLREIDNTKISLVSFDKSAEIVDFKGSNHEVLCSLVIQNVNLLEFMMQTIIKIEEIINKIRLQDIPNINNMLTSHITRLYSLFDLFKDMYDRIKIAEGKLGIERETNVVQDTINEFNKLKAVRR